MAVLFTRCLVARQLLSPKQIERERERERVRRHFEVFGRNIRTGKRGDTRGERKRLPERPTKIVSLPLSWQPLRDLSKILTEND